MQLTPARPPRKQPHTLHDLNLRCRRERPTPELSSFGAFLFGMHRLPILEYHLSVSTLRARPRLAGALNLALGKPDAEGFCCGLVLWSRTATLRAKYFISVTLS